MRRVLGQVGQLTFEKDRDLQVEMAVMEQLGNVLEDGKNIFVGPSESSVSIMFSGATVIVTML